MTINNFKTLETFIAEIDPIDEGKRNETLYRTGLQLRRLFGLHGDNLLRWLRKVNSEKCKPPLEDGEVETIAGSVDKSNAPIGSRRCSIEEYLSKEISFFPSATVNTPSETLSVRQLIDDFRSGSYRKLIKAIRAEPDKERRDALKKQLLAVTIQSEVCKRRGLEFCTNNAIGCIDLDGIDDVEKVKQIIAALSYVFAVILSASGRGLFFLVALAKPTEDLKPILKEIQKDIEFKIDMSCSDISRLRYITHDPDLIVKENVIPFQFQEGTEVSDNAQNPNEPSEGEFFQPFGAFVLNPRRSLPSARAFRNDKYSHHEGFTLHYYVNEFYHWSGSYYQQVSKNTLKRELLHWLNEAVVLQRNGPVPFPANGYAVNDVYKALQSLCQLDEKVKSGAWLGKDEVPLVSSLIFTQNCVYDWKTGEKYPCSPCWFNLSCLNTTIEDDAPKPERWHQFLDELWEDDKESKRLLHEFMGLCLTLDTSFQKILLIVGPRRGGKGTIFRIMGAVLGEENVAAPNAESLVNNFGMQPLLEKPLAIISDARFAGKKIQVAIERLLNISGEDSVMIDKKYRDPLSVKLPTRFMIASNELPMLPDSAGAIANRFLVLRTTKSFLGREDRTLADALKRELPGILKLMLSGLRRLHRQGFTQTSYQSDFIRELEELGSPIRSFVQECCVLGADKIVSCAILWKEWRRWCDDNGQRSETQVVFGRNLKTCFPEIAKKRRGKKYCYLGVGLLPLGLEVAESQVTDDEDSTQ